MGSEGGSYHALRQKIKSSHCIFTEVHKQSQFTSKANALTDSNLTPSVALLVHPSGTVHFIVGYKNDASECRVGYL